ncbi:uncharacterized protein LOC144707396 [Wolffia australiana]
MTPMVHWWRVWHHNLLVEKFMIYTNNMATSCFELQKKLTSKQARWQDFLVEFDFSLKYKPVHANHVVDAMSKKEPETFEMALSRIRRSIIDYINLVLKDVPQALRRMKYSAVGEMRRFCVKDDIIYASVNQPYVSRVGGLRRKLLYEAHDAAMLDI